MHHVEVTAHSAAPPEVVWPVLVDTRRWPAWTFIPSASLEREGEPPPDGVGSIHRLGRAPILTREEVTRFEPPTRYGYILHSGLPLTGYRSDVTLSPDAGGTRIVWRSEFERPKVPGTAAFFRWFLRRMLTGFATGLAGRAAERQ